MELISHKISHKNPKIEIDGKIYIRLDRVKILDGDTVRIIFESAKPKLGQAVVVSTDKWIKTLLKGEKTKAWCFWYDGPDRYLDIECKTKDGILEVSHSWMNQKGYSEMSLGGSAMRIEDLPDGSRRYYCNDGDLDNDFDDLVFRIQFLNKNEKIESIF